MAELSTSCVGGHHRQPRRLHAQPAGPQLRLADRFLAGDVEHGVPGGGEAIGRLEQQRALSDPRIAADQDGGPGHDSAAKDAVEFVQAAGEAGAGVVRLDQFADGGGSGGNSLRRGKRRDETLVVLGRCVERR